MTPLPTTSRSTVFTIGQLCLGGDWACAHGDFAALRRVAQQLADYVPEPVHCQLVELETACHANPERAAILWDQIKSALYRQANA